MHRPGSGQNARQHPVNSFAARRTGRPRSEQAGHARSELLIRALADVHIDAIYSPRLQRNLDTVAPLAASRDLTVRHLPTDNLAARLMADGAGKTIVWVGNKGNIASIWQSLDMVGPAPLAHDDLHFLHSTRFGHPKVTQRPFSL